MRIWNRAPLLGVSCIVHERQYSRVFSCERASLPTLGSMCMHTPSRSPGTYAFPGASGATCAHGRQTLGTKIVVIICAPERPATHTRTQTHTHAHSNMLAYQHAGRYCTNAAQQLARINLALYGRECVYADLHANVLYVPMCV